MKRVIILILLGFLSANSVFAGPDEFGTTLGENRVISSDLSIDNEIHIYDSSSNLLETITLNPEMASGKIINVFGTVDGRIIFLEESLQVDSDQQSVKKITIFSISPDESGKYANRLKRQVGQSVVSLKSIDTSVNQGFFVLSPFDDSRTQLVLPLENGDILYTYSELVEVYGNDQLAAVEEQEYSLNIHDKTTGKTTKTTLEKGHKLIINDQSAQQLPTALISKGYVYINDNYQSVYLYDVRAKKVLARIEIPKKMDNYIGFTLLQDGSLNIADDGTKESLVFDISDMSLRTYSGKSLVHTKLCLNKFLKI